MSVFIATGAYQKLARARELLGGCVSDKISIIDPQEEDGGGVVGGGSYITCARAA